MAKTFILETAAIIAITAQAAQAAECKPAEPEAKWG